MMLICVGVSVFSISGQIREANPAANLDHCFNGKIETPEVCSDVAPDANPNSWGDGNIGPTKGHYREGESVPYRATFTNLTPQTTYSIVLEYDVTKNGKYAFDYLTSYDRTEDGTGFSAGQANPCGDIIPTCNPLNPDSFAIITDDPLTLAAHDPNDNTFDVWGANNLLFEYFSASGSLETTLIRQVKLTFTAQSPTVVLAWGGHIATNADYPGQSAVGITGSPYHVAFADFLRGTVRLGVGQQDHQLGVDAVFFPAVVTIIKNVQNFNSTASYSNIPFAFTASSNFGIPSFQLVDNNLDPGEDFITKNLFAYGPTNRIVITETDPLGTGFQFGNIACSSSGQISIDNNVIVDRTVTIEVEEGESVTCTYTNLQLAPSAGEVSVSGRVTDVNGRGVSGARIAIFGESGERRSVLSNQFGYYTMSDLDAGSTYTSTVSHRRYQFADNIRTFTLNDSLSGNDFVANP